jgi:hypothetical protein
MIKSDALVVTVVAEYDLAVDWVNHNRDLVENGLVEFFGFDAPPMHEEDEGQRLTPTYGVYWQSADCDGFTQLLIH